MGTRKRVVQVAIAVVERNGRYLVTRRRRGQHLAGSWEFPGGKRRVGESWPACLRRELREETGLAVRAARRIMTLRFTYPDRRVYLAVFRCSNPSGRLALPAGTAFRWCTRPQLRRLHFPPANRPLIEFLTHKK